MAGALMRVALEGDDLGARFARLQALTEDTTPLMRIIGAGLVKTTQDRFERGRDPEGHLWAPLLPAYAAIKRGPGILREARMRGGLMGSVTFEAARSSVRVGSNKVYAAIHQFGGVIRPKNAPALRFFLGAPRRMVLVRKVTIPARPYLGFGTADRDVVQDALDFTLARALRDGAAT